MVEFLLPKQAVAGSNPVARSIFLNQVSAPRFVSRVPQSETRALHCFGLHSPHRHARSTQQSAVRLDVIRSRSLQLTEVVLRLVERPQILPCNLPVLLETGVVDIVVCRVRFDTE